MIPNAALTSFITLYPCIVPRYPCIGFFSTCKPSNIFVAFLPERSIADLVVKYSVPFGSPLYTTFPFFNVISLYLSMPGYLPDPCQLFAISDGVLAPFPPRLKLPPNLYLTALYNNPILYNPFDIVLVQLNTDCNVLNVGLSIFPQVSAIFSAAAPIVDTTAITATAKLIFAAVPAATPNAVSNGISAAPPVAATAAIASAAPIMIPTVVTISFQCSLHHSAALSKHISRKFFSASGFR